ncbi:cysteine proteinase inhibitor 6-like [Macadamia integrifolia]|uniref:cysteine proteinase inhibitor 6-like n=1 Tax=Macadamia integrifolia TaxID=60698 RepID=UPI001C5324FF|nr:cysteine proteinase inhibitor 6-like [Macadamia integrifolia]
MATLHYFFFVLVSSLLLLQMTSGIGKSIPPESLSGGWEPLKDVNDPHVQELGKFVVTENNKVSKVDLQFVAVKKGESQVVNGMKYRLVVSAKDHGIVSEYNAEVYEKAWTNTRKLISFTKA